jgi:hypothetical protein
MDHILVNESELVKPQLLESDAKNQWQLANDPSRREYGQEKNDAFKQKPKGLLPPTRLQRKQRDEGEKGNGSMRLCEKCRHAQDYPDRHNPQRARALHRNSRGAQDEQDAKPVVRGIQ